MRIKNSILPQLHSDYFVLRTDIFWYEDNEIPEELVVIHSHGEIQLKIYKLKNKTDKEIIDIVADLFEKCANEAINAKNRRE